MTGHLARYVALLFALFLLPVRAEAHPMDNATLLIRERAGGSFEVRFQAGSAALAAIESPAVYPSDCRLEGATLTCGPAGLSGTIEFPWLEGTLTQLLVSVAWRDGSRLERLVSPDSAHLTLYDHGATGWAALWPVLSDYGVLGAEHILFGFDHLCFVLVLTLLVEGRRRLVATITAFTVAHSITLAASVLGLLRVPVAPVEALIALSIVLVSAEVLRPEQSLTRRAPWIVAFTFGLLHGFGFASALAEVGLPTARLPSALLGFNLGVEVGQVAVVLAALEAAVLLERWKLGRPWMATAATYAMGSLAAYWTLDRLLTVLGVT